MLIDIPNYKNLDIKYLVCDYNGTIAKDGKLLDGVGEYLNSLSSYFEEIFVITADTFGSVKKELSSFDIKIKLLSTSNHTQEKGDFIEFLGSSHAMAIGNGNNDVLMLQKATISIAIIGDEGCSSQAILNSKITTNNILDALSLIKNPKRLIATLRA